VKALTTLAVLLAAAVSSAHAQSSSAVMKDGTKPRPDPQPFYTPYTGPGFGNPDANAKKDHEPVGTSRKKYNDGPGTSAYSRGGNTEVTPINQPKIGVPKRKPKSENANAAPPAPAAATEKR